ncbi:MAG: DUF1449 family protein [Alphaproteobacteria bacterium]|nr:DUF1449 family protein [Alphaproteobacteria bacterium]
MEQLATSPFLPFSVAGLVAVGLTVVEIATSLVGKPLSAVVHELGLDHGALDHDIGAADGLAGSKGLVAKSLDWLNVGRVPLLILLLLLTATFAASGLVIQGIAGSILAPLPWPAAVPIAAVVSFRLTRSASRAWQRWFPRDESYALAAGDFVGLTGVVVLGPVRQGSVAKVRIRDRSGNTHFPRAEPHVAGDVFEEGENVLVVESRGVTVAVARAPDSLQR